MMDKSIEAQIIEAGVKNLHTFGYPAANAENILTDPIYSVFFKSMLNGSIGQSKIADKIIHNLLTKLPKENT